MSQENILVIKLGALGDFVYAIGPMQAIKKHHKTAKITLLTRLSFADLGYKTKIFDDILIDPEPNFWKLKSLYDFRKKINSFQFDRIYDLQTSDRTGFYYKLLGPFKRPEWSGIAPGCSHYHHYKRPTLKHTQDRHREQLALAGINEVLHPDLSFMEGETRSFGLPPNYALIVPGSSPKMKVKRWPSKNFSYISKLLIKRGITPVLIGGTDDAETINAIQKTCCGTIGLIGKTDIFQISSLARKAKICIGNDTGPMHLIALSGCPTVALFGLGSFPDKAAPRGAHVKVLVNENLINLAVNEVQVAIADLLEAN